MNEQNSESRANSTEMLWVGCKLPNGLLCEMGKFGDDGYQAYTLNGANSSRVHGGYGLTHVPADFWAAWVKKNKRLTFVQKAMVFAQGDLASAEGHAIDLTAVKTGMESLDPHKKVTNPLTGEVLLEVDSSHFAQAKRDMAQIRQNRA